MTEIRDILIAAMEDVDQADIPEPLREAAFMKAVDLRAAGAPTGAAAGSGGVPPALVADSALGRIAVKLGLDVEVVSDVYDDADGEIELIVASGKLPPSAATATKEIALLIAAARQGAGLEGWTPLSRVRVVCEDYKRLDSANFASTVKEMRNIFTVRGSPRQREVKMTRPAWDDAAQLVRRLAGGE